MNIWLYRTWPLAPSLCISIAAMNHYNEHHYNEHLVIQNMTLGYYEQTHCTFMWTPLLALHCTLRISSAGNNKGNDTPDPHPNIKIWNTPRGTGNSQSSHREYAMYDRCKVDYVFLYSRKWPCLSTNAITCLQCIGQSYHHSTISVESKFKIC